MTLDEIQREIDRISWGARYAKVKNSAGREHFIVLKSLSLADRNWVNFIYEQALEEGRELGLLKESDLLSAYNEAGIWTNVQENRLNQLKTDIEKLEKGLSDEEQGSLGRRKIESLLRGARRAHQALSQERFERLSASLERFAEDRKLYAILWCSAHKMDGTKVWPSWEEFEEESDIDFVNTMLRALLDYKPANVKEIRKMARSPLWRYKWNGAKNCDDLFGKPVVELDPEQESLVYWSQVYDAAYEAYERPPDHVIDDDDALDKWFEEQDKKRKAEDVKSGKSKDKLHVSERVGRHGEIFIVANKDINPEAPEAEEIWELNPDGTKKFIKQQMRTIKESKTINERNLRTDYTSRMMAGSKRAEFEVRGGKKKVNKLYEY